MMVAIQETGYTTKHYQDKDRYIDIDVVLFKDRLYSVAIHTTTVEGRKTIELTPYEIKLVLEVLRQHPLPEEVEE